MKPEKLIVGSFPCFNGINYGDWFYSGSGKNFLWKLLSDLYAMPAGNRTEKEALCERFGIALTDIGYKIERKKADCSDSNLRIIEPNVEGIKKCMVPGIQQVLFTSRFVESHFKRLFPEFKIPSVVLISPSPAANIHIGGLDEYKKMIAAGSIKNPYEYRLLKYREALRK